MSAVVNYLTKLFVTYYINAVNRTAAPGLEGLLFCFALAIPLGVEFFAVFAWGMSRIMALSYYTTETVHEASVKDGSVQTQLNGKKAAINIKQLRQVIPEHCFEPSIARSMAYIALDIVAYTTLLTVAIWINTWASVWAGLYIRYAVFPFMASLPLVGLWVIGHECGHGAFSGSRVVNNTVGFLLHSALLTPYFAWRSSHGRHHQYANNMSTDLNYVPFTHEEYALSRGAHWDHVGEDSPIVTTCRIILQQVIGWPWYLLTHITAGPESSPRKSRGWWDNSHFLPSSSLFRSSEFWHILASDVGVAAAAYCLYRLCGHFGSWTILWTYVLPWVWVNHWIVMITYLHHTEPSLPKFTENSWTYLRGALATVDRDPGFVLKYTFHHIIDTHVVHHLFPRIPHYHAQEATKAIVPLLGSLYHTDKTPYWRALWNSFTLCQWVGPNSEKTENLGLSADAVSQSSDDSGVLWYQAGPLPPVVTTMRRSEKTT